MDIGLQTLRSNARMVLDILRSDIEVEGASNDYLTDMRGKLTGVSLMLAGNYGIDDLITEIASLTDEIHALQDENYTSVRKVV